MAQLVKLRTPIF